MDISNKLDNALNKYVRVSSFTVAVKVAQEEIIPVGAKRPSLFLGHPINICQGISITRRYGWFLGFLKEDHACSISHVIMGLVEEPDFIKNGSVVYPLYAESLKAGANTQMAVPHMPLGKIRSILLAPLNRADFEPDVVLIYGNPGQTVRLIQAALYKEGGKIESHFMGRAACGAEIVTPLLTKKCNVIVPGGGEKVFAQTGDDEMVFAAPKEKIDDLIYGLEATHRAGAARFPVPQFGLRIKPAFPKEYMELEKYCGIK